MQGVGCMAWGKGGHGFSGHQTVWQGSYGPLVTLRVQGSVVRIRGSRIRGNPSPQGHPTLGVAHGWTLGDSYLVGWGKHGSLRLMVTGMDAS